MAYRPWSNYIWTEIWSNGSYALDIQWRHRIDPINNLIWYSACQWRIRKVASQWFYDEDCPIGMGVITDTRVTGTTRVHLGETSSVIYNFADVGREIKANSSGVASGMYYLHVYCKPSGVTGPVPTGWYTKDITSLLPKIDRGTGTTTLSTNSVTFSSITLNIESSVYSSLGRYRINGGSWIEFATSSALQVTGGGTMTKVFSGLLPNTSYKIEVQCRRDYNELWAPVYALTTTTQKPSLPTIRDLKLTSNIYNQQIYTWSGAYGTGHPSNLYGAYEYRVNGGDWQSTSTSSATLNCSPNTLYKFEVRLRDYYNQYSSILTNSATTPKPSAPTKGKVDVSEITTNQATITISGFKLGEGASSGSYRYRLNGGSWIDIGNKTTYTITNLGEETTYNIEVQMIDNYGTVSPSATVIFTTLSEQLKFYIKVDGHQKLGKASLKANGDFKKIKSVHKKENGAWIKKA